MVTASTSTTAAAPTAGPRHQQSRFEPRPTAGISLHDVPLVVLEAARDVMRRAASLRDVDEDLAEPLADAVIMSALPLLRQWLRSQQEWSERVINTLLAADVRASPRTSPSQQTGAGDDGLVDCAWSFGS